MSLEAIMICIDNSDWMRNGDYNPTRMQSQLDAVNVLCTSKLNANVENTAGVIACAGRTPKVLVSLTSDVGSILTSLHDIKLEGSLNFLSGLQVAQLALKYRQNKNQQQRIIFFVGSPIYDDKDEIINVAKKLKKNNIAVDIISFGEESLNTEKVEAFINTINNNNNSSLVTIPPGPHILSDVLVSSPILGGFGVPTADEDALLAQAIALSMQEAQAAAMSEQQSAITQPTQSTKPTTNDVDMKDLTEDEEMALALQMSLQSAQQEQQKQQEEHQKQQEEQQKKNVVDNQEINETLED